MYSRFISITAALLVAVSAYARHTAADTLDVAIVTAEKGLIISRTDTVSLSSQTDASEALLNITGLSISDMGGFAGLKTVSLRGMGTAQTSLYIDGIKIGNLQSGQADLGMLDVSKLSSAVIDYAQNSINFSTAKPVFTDGKKTATEISFKGGSFASYIPRIRFGWKINESLSMNINVAGRFSNGNFPYYSTDEAGEQHKFRRTGNDIKQVSGSADFFGKLSKGEWQAKLYLNKSDRGTPGSLSWPSNDRQKDMNIFLQASLKKKFRKFYDLRLSAKTAFDDLSYFSSWGDSNYKQYELQVNNSHIFTIRDWWKASVALGLQWDRLFSGNYSNSAEGNAAIDGIDRFEITGAIASNFVLDRFKGDIALEYENIMSFLSPSASVQYDVFEGFDIHAFARRAYRIPTFNELYYIGYGNKDLKAEDAWLSGIGLQWKYNIGEHSYILNKADGFFNFLDNKISSAPSESDPNIWLPYNIGKVFSAGFDFLSRYQYESRNWKTSFSVKYTYQDAKDKTEGSYTYNKQIPYVARHSGTLSADVFWKGWTADLHWILRCDRNDNTGDMPDWNTVDLGLSKSINFGKQSAASRITLSIKCSNLFNMSYELSRGYPMPGRAILGGISIEL